MTAQPQTNPPASPRPQSPELRYARERGRPPWRVLALGLSFFAIALAAFLYRALFIGSDGANTDGRTLAFRPGYMEVYAYPGSRGPLQTGDRVVAVADVTMRDWAQRLFQPGSEHYSFAPDTLVVYRIIRKGQAFTILVALKQTPLLSIFRARWGFFAFVLITQLLATWLLLRRPQLPAARVFFIWAMLGSQMYVWALPLQVGDVVTGYGFWLGRFLVSWMAVLFYPALVHFALVYPQPLEALRRRRWLLPAIYLGSVLLYLGLFFWFWASESTTLGVLHASNNAVSVISVVYLVAALGVVIFQYFHSRPGPDRQRAKWALLGGSLALISGLFLGVVAPVFIGQVGVDINVYGLTLLAFPISMTIAMWRYHLFDVDVIIRRTFLYTVVTAILVVCYLGAIIFLEGFFRQFTRQNSRPAVALATAAIMLLFNPVRVRVQSSIDRLFYRTSYDPTRLLARFAAATRDEADLPKLMTAMEDTISSSLQPASIHIWLAPRVRHEEAQEG